MIKVTQFHENHFNTDLMYGTFTISFFSKIGISISIFKKATDIWVICVPKESTYRIQVYYSFKEYRKDKENE